MQRRNESLINVDVRDKETGNTPVIWAAKRGHIKVLVIDNFEEKKILLEFFTSGSVVWFSFM